MEKLEFNEVYINSRMLTIKRKFIQACKNDKKLSKEFKAHISNINNIEVRLKPKYDFEFYAFFNSITADYSYEYTYTYSYNSHLAGEIKYDYSTGKADTSGLRMVKEYDTAVSTRKGTAYFWATKTQDCKIHFGSATFDDSNIKDYVRITNKSKLAGDLKKLAQKRFDYSDVNRYLTINALPSHVYSALKENAFQFRSSSENPRDLRMKIKDYSIDEISLIIFPDYCEFEVWTVFNGKEYKQTGKDIKDIISVGEESNHYQQYKEEEEAVLIEYEPKYWPRRKIYLASALVCLFVALIMAVLLAISPIIKHEALLYIHWWKIVIILVITMILFFVSLNIRGKQKFLNIPEWIYEPDKSLPTLRAILNENCEIQRKEATKFAAVWLGIILFIMSGMGIFTGCLYKATYNEHYWYTPEIVQVYTGEYSKYSCDVILTILSCDEDGGVDAIIEYKRTKSNGKTLYAKLKYSGQVTKKNFLKTEVKLKFVEMLEDPNSYPIDDEKELSVKLKKHYNIISETGVYLYPQGITTSE